MAWADFELETSLERDLLNRALPLTSGDAGTVRIDLAADTAQIAMTFSESLGSTPGGCVKLLRIRPLMFGAAWKVLDLLLEEAFEQAGLQPSGRRWMIAEKAQLAASAAACPVPFAADEWGALTGVYVATEDLRHSLVHRRADMDPNGALIGRDGSGQHGTPVTEQEQDAFVHAVLRAATLVVRGADSRTAGDLRARLAALGAHHGVNVLGAELQPVPEVTVLVDRVDDEADVYELDLDALRARQPFKAAIYIDVLVVPRSRPERSLRGRLEDAPDGVVSIDLNSPPPWLQ
jgi:hypothetical protein